MKFYIASATLALFLTAPLTAQTALYGTGAASRGTAQGASFTAPAQGGNVVEQIVNWPSKPPKSGAAFDVISHGADINWADYAVPGQITLFDFWSRTCVPCIKKAPTVAAAAGKTMTLHEKRYKLHVRIVDIGGYESALWKKYGPSLKSLPYLAVIGPDGKIVTEGAQANQVLFGTNGNNGLLHTIISSPQ